MVSWSRHLYLHSGTDGQAYRGARDAVRLQQEKKQPRSKEENVHLHTHRQAVAHATQTPPGPKNHAGELAIVSMKILLLTMHCFVATSETAAPNCTKLHLNIFTVVRATKWPRFCRYDNTCTQSTCSGGTGISQRTEATWPPRR